MAREVVVRPTGTSWGAVIDGWLATVGVAAILTPITGLLLTSWYPTRGYASTVPILVAVGVAYLVGGYVAGRMAGHRTSWHGMMVSFFGLFVVLALLVVDIAFALGTLGAAGRLLQILPQVLGVTLYQSTETLAFGGALGLLIAVFAGWLGGLLAPARITTAVPSRSLDATPVVEEHHAEERRVTKTEVHKPRERYRLLPGAGQKGGERVHEVDTVERVERADPIEPS